MAERDGTGRDGRRLSGEEGLSGEKGNLHLASMEGNRACSYSPYGLHVSSISSPAMLGSLGRQSLCPPSFEGKHEPMQGVEADKQLLVQTAKNGVRIPNINSSCDK